MPSPTSSSKRLVGTSEAAELLGVSKSTVYRMVTQGILTPSKTPGGQRRFATSDLLAYLHQSVTIKAAQRPPVAEANAGSGEVDSRNKLNELTGAEWIPATKSFVYQRGLGSNHPHAAIERQHPAPFSFQDIQQLIEFFTKTDMTVLDPFGGVGSTAKAAALSHRHCISIELQKKWHDLAVQRLETEVHTGAAAEHQLINDDSRRVLAMMQPEQVDFIVTSPPYWSILNKRPDQKVKRDRVSKNLATNYSQSDPADLANIEDYDEFNRTLVNEFILPAFSALRTGKYFCLIVSDFRHRSRFISFHSDLIQLLDSQPVQSGGVVHLQGVKILLQNHKALFPYGYPFAYVENIHHQYILIFRKTVK